MLQTFIRYRLRILLILSVFGLFLFSIAGLLDIHLYLTNDLMLRSDLPARLYSRLLLTPQYARAEFILFIATGLLLSFSLPCLSPIKASAMTLVCMLVPVYLGISQPGSGDLVPMEYHLLTILILFVVNMGSSYFMETHEKQKLMEIFGHYVPPELVDALSTQTDAVNLSGEARELTVLFCDIKGFTAISESLEPRQLAAYLNAYFTCMTRILYRHGATIDKYMGDAIMCFWGAPVHQPDHARRAVLAALEMQQALGPLAISFEKKGWPKIELGIGINTGVMNVGNMGSQYRVAYTVVGDAVNLGSRLEHLTRRYAMDIIISDSTRQAVDDLACIELDQVRVKGKVRTTRIFAPLGPGSEVSPARQRSLEVHQVALDAYYRQDWETAEKLFRQLKSEEGLDGYYALMLDRVDEYRLHPPAQDWSGETSYQSV